LIVVLAVLLAGGSLRAGDWVQLGCNAARTSYTPDEPKGPYKVAWVFDGVWPDDRLLATVQVVTWKRKGFVGSKRGTMYAFSLTDGKGLWKYRTGRAILQTAAVADGLVVFGSMDGCVYAVGAEDGKLAWKTDLKARGITNAPLVYEGRIYIGTRGGLFACLNATDGSVIWKKSFESPIFQSPAAGDGKVFFSPEDMYMRCLDAATGKLLWRAERRMTIATLRGTHPVYHKGLLFTGNGSKYNSYKYRGGHAPAVKMPADMPPTDRKNTHMIDAKDFYPSYAKWLKDYDEDLRKRGASNALLIFDAKTGRQLPGLPMAGHQSMACPLQAPAVTADGLVVYPQRYADWSSHVGLFDPFSRELKAILVHQYYTNDDETQNFSVGGNTVFTVHTWEGHPGTMLAFDLTRKKRFELPEAYPRIMGEWKAAPPSNAASICGNLLFHVGGHRVAAWKGTSE